LAAKNTLTDLDARWVEEAFAVLVAGLKSSPKPASATAAPASSSSVSMGTPIVSTDAKQPPAGTGISMIDAGTYSICGQHFPDRRRSFRA
jgi:hypothetical protein